MRWVGHVEPTEEEINTHRIVEENHERGKLLVRPRHRQQGNVKICVN
jgi:hypothetical protein